MAKESTGSNQVRASVAVPRFLTLAFIVLTVIALAIRFHSSARFLPAYLVIIGVVSIPLGIVVSAIACAVVSRNEGETRAQVALRYFLFGASAAVFLTAVILPYLEDPQPVS